MPIEVDYRFLPGTDVEKQARAIAIGQTAGTWNARFDHLQASFEQHLGQVVATRTEADGCGVATVQFPEINVENDISSLLTMIFGKYSMAGAAKVMAVRLPEGYGKRPKLGITGIRRRLGIGDAEMPRPLVMAIFKPAMGLSAADHAGILREVAMAGLDVIKDDEIMTNLASAPTLERLRACRQAIDEVYERTGRRVLYAVNVTSNVGGNPLATARQLVESGANALLLNVLTYGFAALEAIAADPDIDVPIFVHPAFAGAICASKDTGMAYSVVLGTLMAHGGADAVLYPAHYGSLPFDPVEEASIRDSLRQRNVFPVPSAGIHPGIVPRALADYGNDVVLNAGTGIMDHPAGAAAGVRAFFEALEWHRQGKPWHVAEMPESALRQALEKWGM